MDHNRLSINITSGEDILDAIQSFLTDVGWATPWEEDATFANGANPGHLFMRSAGGSKVYVYFHVVGDMVHAGIVGTDAGAAGWAGAAAPTASANLNITDALAEGGVGLGWDASDEVDGKLHLVADEDRLVCLLQKSARDIWNLLYIGFYHPLAAGATDPDPICVVGNSHAEVFPSGLPNDPRLPEEDPRLMFPAGVLKTDPAGLRRRYLRAESGHWVGGAVYGIPTPEQPIPRNDRAVGDEVFSFNQWLTIPESGRGEAFGLSGSAGTNGVLRTANGLKPLDTVTIGADNYLVAPMALRPGHNSACALVGPIGAAI